MPRNALGRLGEDSNALRPDTLPDGSPDPDATAGLLQLYRDWKARGVDMPPLDEWLRGAASEYGNALLMGTTAPGGRVANPIRAYHGSPGSFERFSDQFIGTGEGAQAFGYGHYVGEAESTGKYYRDNLTGAIANSQTAQGAAERALASGSTREEALSILRSNLRATEATLAKMGDKAPPGVVADKPTYEQAINMVETGYKPGGHMYEVDVHADPEHFLHWDKPLSEQSPHVQEALAGLDYPRAEVRPSRTFGGYGVYKPGFAAPYATAATPEEARALAAQVDNTVRGENLYQAIPGSHAEVSEKLQDAGIPGIRYLDQGSRGAGEGTSNYVVFDPATIEILRKYGIAGLGLGGAAATGASPQSE